MRKCNKCSESKCEEFFHIKNKKLSNTCKSCHNLYMRAYYSKNKSKHKGLVRSSKRKYIKTVDNLIFKEKDKPCMDCGIKYHPFVMDFNHRDPSSKAYLISAMGNRGSSLLKIKEEIDKCDLVCANCHRMRTLNNTVQRRYKKI